MAKSFADNWQQTQPQSTRVVLNLEIIGPLFPQHPRFPPRTAERIFRTIGAFRSMNSFGLARVSCVVLKWCFSNVQNGVWGEKKKLNIRV